MIIFFKKNSLAGYSSPIALVDYTRSDDQFSLLEIQRLVLQTAGEQSIAVNVADLSVFSLDYTVEHTHSAVNLGDALKSKTTVTVSNAPPELVALVQVQQIVGQETALSLQNGLGKILDPKNEFSRGVMISKISGPLGEQNLVRSFIVYGTVYNFDPRRINSTLLIKGAAFDSMVMRIQLAFDLKKTLPLVAQIQTAVNASEPGWTVTTDPDIQALPPVVERYYPPAPLNKLLQNVCVDNGVFFDLDSTNKTIKLKSLSNAATPVGFLPSKLSFRGSVQESLIISSFSVRDYANAIIQSEAWDVSLFDRVDIYNDSKSSDLFTNFRKNDVPPPLLFRGGLLFSYAFYVLEYTFLFSATLSRLELKATNNWLLANFKLDTFMENAIYGGVS